MYTTSTSASFEIGSWTDETVLNCRVMQYVLVNFHLLYALVLHEGWIPQHTKLRSCSCQVCVCVCVSEAGIPPQTGPFTDHKSNLQAFTAGTTTVSFTQCFLFLRAPSLFQLLYSRQAEVVAEDLGLGASLKTLNVPVLDCPRPSQCISMIQHVLAVFVCGKG